MIDVVEGDTLLPASLRRQFSDVRPLVADDPELALARLVGMAATVALGLHRDLPEHDLAKCAGIEGFFSFYLADDVRAFFRGPEEYRRRIEAVSDREMVLLNDLSTTTPLIPAENSWLTDWNSIASMSGTRLRKHLSIRPLPPFVVLVMVLRDLLLSGVTVREPRAVDAIPRRLTEWVPGGLPSGGLEYIDGPMPRTAVSRVVWKP
jgi:hypothetical protein